MAQADRPDRWCARTLYGRVVMVSACGGHGFKFGAWRPSWAAKALTEEIPFDKAADHMAGLDQPIPAK
jgi:hypothetical protein